MTDERKCQWDGCDADAVSEPAGSYRVDAGEESVELDVYLCRPHRDVLVRGVSAHLSISVKPTPARPEVEPL